MRRRRARGRERQRARLRGRARSARCRRRGAAIVELRHETPRTPAPTRRRTAASPSTREPPFAEALGNGHVAACASPPSRGRAVRAERARHRVRLRGDQRRLRPAGNLIWYAGGRFAYDEDTAMHRAVELLQGECRRARSMACGTSTRSWPMAGAPAGMRRGFWGAPRASRRRRPPDALSSQITHPVANLPAPAGQGLRRFRRGPGGQGHSGTRCSMATTTSSCSSATPRSAWGRARAGTRASPRSACSPRPRAAASRRSARPRRGSAAEKFAHLAGRGFDPVRHTAMHHRHLELGARMMVAGAWLRPAYYGQGRCQR